jgi:hypothetical protein
MIEIIQTKSGRGLGVVATKDLHPGIFGLKVITEEALIVFPTLGTDEDQSGGSKVPKFLEPCPQVYADWYRYLQEPQSIKDQILMLYNELDCRTYKTRLYIYI